MKGWRPLVVGAASHLVGAPRQLRHNSSRRMSGPRVTFAVLAFLALAPSAAVAADMPEILRGSYLPKYPRWEGFYFGAQGGQTFASADFSGTTGSLVSYILANTELEPILSNWTAALGKGSTGGASYGGFVGYNFQWDDAVLSAELNYNHMSLKTGQQDSLGPIVVPGATQSDGSTVQYVVTETSGASISIHDIATVRGRAGWTFDSFMPYGFVGLAVGLFDFSRFASVTGTKTVTPTSGPPVTGTLILPRSPHSEGQDNVVGYGFTAGLGVEVALLPNVFARAEWEFVQFPNISDIRVEMNSARAGIGVKF